jgi:hypothetical protein
MAVENQQAPDFQTLVIVEHEEAMKGYRLGRIWLLGKEWEGPIPGTNYLIDNLKAMAKHGLFSSENDDCLNWHIGFLLGMLSSSISVQSGE